MDREQSVGGRRASARPQGATREPRPASETGRGRDAVRIGVISDTHGLLRPGVFELFEGVALILHAGDVGAPAILAELETIAPVTAVWGNVDGWETRERTLETASGETAGLRWAVTHGHRVQPAYERLVDHFPEADLVVHGHTHEPALTRVGSALLLNPGAAGPKRFGKPVTVALVEVGADGAPSVRHLDLETGEAFRV